MIHIVETTESAEVEFEEQYNYLLERSPQGANAWAIAFRNALKKLETNPASRPLAPESEYQAETIHQLVFKTRHGNPYRALFIIRTDRVYVIHIRGQGQDIMPPETVQIPKPD